MIYAVKTKVAVSTTRQSVEKMLRRAGAERIITMDEPLEATVAFRLANRLIQMHVPVPGNASDQVRRTLWRNIDLIVRAKLAAIAENIATVEQEFLAYVVMPGGGTVHARVRENLRLSYESGENVPLLPGPTST